MFEFTATDTGGSTVRSFQCSLDGAAYATCDSGVIFRDLTDGRHTFAVRATDGVGNVESPAAAYEWEVSSLFAADDEATTREDTAIWIDVSQNDALVGATIAADAQSQAGGTVTGNGGEVLRYTPPDNWSGTDHFGYTATRGGDSVSATVTVHVLAVNDPPAFRPGGAITVDEDSGTYRAPWASAITAGEPGEGVRFTLSTSNAALFSSLPAISPQGELTFTPAPNAYGTAVAQIQAINDTGVRRSGSVTITVNPVDDAPTITVARDVRCGRSDNGTFRLLVHDIDSDASKVTVSGSSTSDRVGLEFGGSANERTVSITRRPGLRRALVTVHLTDGAHDFAIPVRLAVGTNRGDRMRGTAGPDLLFGLGGRDRIAARGGNDLICGGGGADRIDGGTGDDVVIGGRGDDVVRGGAGDDVVRGDTGADDLVGGPGDDILRGGPRADLFAPAPGADTLVDFNEAQGDHR
jgi:Ca2+-binding RTX toxin-like protein